MEFSNFDALKETEIKTGHMPGAVNVSFPDILKLPSCCLKSKEELKECKYQPKCHVDYIISRYLFLEVSTAGHC